MSAFPAATACLTAAGASAGAAATPVCGLIVAVGPGVSGNGPRAAAGQPLGPVAPVGGGSWPRDAAVPEDGASAISTGVFEIPSGAPPCHHTSMRYGIDWPGPWP